MSPFLYNRDDTGAYRCCEIARIWMDGYGSINNNSIKVSIKLKGEFQPIEIGRFNMEDKKEAREFYLKKLHTLEQEALATLF